MSDKLILVLNCGSSSLKGAVLDNDSGEVLLSCLAEKLNLPDAFITFKFNGEKHTTSLAANPNHTGAVEALMEELRAHSLDGRIGAIGHRVVSGGELYSESILITDEVVEGIEKCIPLAPLHNPAHLLGIRAAQSIFKGLPNVAVFDTAFHQTMPEHAYTYAVPRELYRKYGLRRYGAHGTSYRFVADETARFLGKDKNKLRMVIAHLGNGASIAAVADGKCQDTSMGLTPLEGLVMGTRSGDIDPSVFSFLAQNANMNITQITDMLNKKSGLLGVSELSNDCRTIEEEAGKGHEGAKLALEVFSYRLAKYIGSMSVAAGGLDALVFTGGIGENSNLIRSKVLAYLGFLGLTEDAGANEKARFGNAGVITTADSKAVAVVIPTNEELMIAHDTARLSGL
ncbi:acetate kinase [Neisseria animaloris]|uniref:Acetate kinase n=1 Tax=Neisseria animaloris TaxID=326522 RepID=A0A1X3CHK6_9NEIS|nr:acetate kinase [Neisseria animaloris]OSI06747.1 acetate kinase [Neisseria animaloris]VEH86854.1 acetate kinase [Neisseria animaloris]VEJ21013.1 acetate kinase [Neisseria animaloris]